MFSRIGRSTVWAIGLIGILTCVAYPQTNHTEFFEMRVRPVLARNCLACHGQSQLGGLRLDSREGMLKGGKSGTAVVPGQPDASILIQAVQQTHPHLKMPPQGKLKDEEIADLRRWVGEGAIWPLQSAPSPRSITTAEQRSFWSFQPVHKPVVPRPKDETWAKTAIDRFIQRGLKRRASGPPKRPTSGRSCGELPST